MRYSRSNIAKGHDDGMNNSLSMLTFDVEDWFQAKTLSKYFEISKWDFCEKRIARSLDLILEDLEESSVKATFFFLGWIAERMPEVVLDVYRAGHEVASHGYGHLPVYKQTRNEFDNDIRKTKILLEKITGAEVMGYRAPSFFLLDWAIEVIKDVGYRYDSSYFMSSLHRKHIKLNSSFSISRPAQGRIFKFDNGLIEVPIPVINFGSILIPWNNYFRFVPYSLFKKGAKMMASAGDFVFYFHPWEIDYMQPRVNKIKLEDKVKHYAGIKDANKKLRMILKDFSFTSVKNYLRINH